MTGESEPGVHVDEESGTVEIVGERIELNRPEKTDRDVGIYVDGDDVEIVGESIDFIQKEP
jgi:hypothetical protein